MEARVVSTQPPSEEFSVLVFTVPMQGTLLWRPLFLTAASQLESARRESLEVLAPAVEGHRLAFMIHHSCSSELRPWPINDLKEGVKSLTPGGQGSPILIFTRTIVWVSPFLRDR